MSALTIALIAFLSGGLVTGGTIWGIQSAENKKEKTADVIEAIAGLETRFEQAQATSVTNLTEPDLLKIPCSSEFINGTFNDEGDQISPANGDMLCREMFCRMNRQGGGQNSSGGAGATAQECSAISDANISVLIVKACMPYWEEKSGADQNSRYSRCIDIFSDAK